MPFAQRAEGDTSVRIAYEWRDEAGGDAPVVVLIHGLGYARWGWEPVVPGLAARYRLLLLDNRGIGESDVPPGPYTTRQLAEDVAAVCDDAGVDRAAVVGTSLGGMIAQEFALTHRDRLDRLVLVCSTPGGDRGVPMPAVTRELLAAMPGLPPEEALTRAVHNALSPRTVAERPEIAARILEHRRAAPPHPGGWQAQAAAAQAHDSAERLAAFDAPTLVLHGTEDVVVDPGNAELLAALLPDAELRWFEGAGHLLFWEQPDRFVDEVAAFLDGGP